MPYDVLLISIVNSVCSSDTTSFCFPTPRLGLTPPRLEPMSRHGLIKRLGLIIRLGLTPWLGPTPRFGTFTGEVDGVINFLEDAFYK